LSRASVSDGKGQLVNLMKRELLSGPFEKLQWKGSSREGHRKQTHKNIKKQKKKLLEMIGSGISSLTDTDKNKKKETGRISRSSQVHWNDWKSRKL